VATTGGGAGGVRSAYQPVTPAMTAATMAATMMAVRLIGSDPFRGDSR
jgi:hypothetical protein